jgi:aryl-alcohol dehydrogenase-like predicted oxidoreductase
MVVAVNGEREVGELCSYQRDARFLGLSEAAPATVRRAHKVHPLSAVQTDLSLWSRDPEDELLPTLRELGIALVAYSPLGRGFLGGPFTKLEDLAGDVAPEQSAVPERELREEPRRRRGKHSPESRLSRQHRTRGAQRNRRRGALSPAGAGARRSLIPQRGCSPTRFVTLRRAGP